MKRCPTCNKTYSDDSMSFCLEDGAPLLSVGAEAPPASGSFDPNLTIPFTPPRDTAEQGSGQWGAPTGGPTSGGQSGPPSGYGQQPGSGQYGQPSGSQYGQQGSGQWGAPAGGPQSGQFPPPPSGQFPPPQGGQYQPTPGWTPPQQSFGGPQKKSSALPWILGGIGALIVLGVVGAVLIGVLASMGSKANKNNSNNSNSTNSNRSNRNGSTANTSNSNNSNTGSTSSGTPVASDDFSAQNWWVGTVNVGTASYQNGEYHLHSNSGGYMVVYGPESFRTENAITRITARSISGSSPSNGYGLAVFGEMTKKKELEDYCFLIRTDDSPSYRIVMHRGGNETVLVDWTQASQIRTGTSPNQLEVRANGTRAAFYINGQYAGAVDATKGYDFGLAGLYTSGTEEVAFDDLQISKP